MEQIELKDRELPGDILNYIHTLEYEVESLQEKLQLALFKKYGRSSEKIDPSQIDFFEVPEADEEPIEEDATTVASHTRKKKEWKKIL